MVSEIFHLLPTYCPTAQMADFMFQNVVYRATVYRTGDNMSKKVVNLSKTLSKQKYARKSEAILLKVGKYQKVSHFINKVDGEMISSILLKIGRK